jgi:hypothetical protein
MSLFALQILTLFLIALVVVALVNLAMSKQYLLFTPKFRYPVRDEGIQFTAYRPDVIEVDKPYKIIVFAHTTMLAAGESKPQVDPAAEIKERVSKALSGEDAGYQARGADAKRALPRDGLVTFKLLFEGLKFEGSTTYSFSWTGELHQKNFTFTAPPDLEGKVVYGKLRVQAGIILIAEIALSLRVDTAIARSAPTPGFVAQSASPYRNIFVSYSRKDWPVVKRVMGYVSSTGDKFLVDVEDLRAGQEWQPGLLELIRQADVFQLFWSSNAMKSPEVRKEWEFALSLHKPNFVRASYWEDPLPKDEKLGLPPPDLDATHFYKIPIEPDPVTRAAAGFGVGHSLGVAFLMMSVVSNALMFSEKGVVLDPDLLAEVRATPIVTPSPMASPTPTPIAGLSPTPIVEISPTPNPTPSLRFSPTPRPTPRTTPTPRPTPEPTPRKVDEYGNIRFNDDKAPLDNYAIELQNDPAAQGYLICYGGRKGRMGEAQKRCNRAKDYLVMTRGIDPSRIVMVDGGYKEEEEVELWIVPNGAAPPVPRPTIDAPKLQTTPTPPVFSGTPSSATVETPLRPRHARYAGAGQAIQHVDRRHVPEFNPGQIRATFRVACAVAAKTFALKPATVIIGVRDRPGRLRASPQTSFRKTRPHGRRNSSEVTQEGGEDLEPMEKKQSRN